MNLLLQKEFASRRKKLKKSLQSDEVLICFSASLQKRSHDTSFPFRQNSNFYYLTGLDSTEGVLLISKKSEILFVKEKSALEKKWDGESLSLPQIKKCHWIEEAISLDKFSIKYLSGFNHLILPWFNENQKSLALWSELTSSTRRSYPTRCTDLDEYLKPFRKTKTSWEIKQIRKSCQIATRAHTKLKSFVSVGKNEKECADFILNEFLKGGAQGVAYDTIMAGGNNANTLHYIQNNQTLRNGDLLLVDAGCEYNFYASDITRTYPVNGIWSKEQKLIHDLVAKAKSDCIKIIKPGVSIVKLQLKARQVLAQGLIDLKILKGRISDVLVSAEFRELFPHGLGHSLGLDVHDIYQYPKNPKDLSVKLEVGELLTVEPGLYFDKKNRSVPKEFRGIGIRLEDDILVTKKGCENLTVLDF